MNNDSRKEETERVKKRINLIEKRIRNLTIQKRISGLRSIIIIIVIIITILSTIVDMGPNTTPIGILLLMLFLILSILVGILQTYDIYLRNKIIKVSMNKTDMKKITKVGLTQNVMKKCLTFTLIYWPLSYILFYTNSIHKLEINMYITVAKIIIYVLSILVIFIYHSKVYVDDEKLFDKEFVLKEQKTEIVRIGFRRYRQRYRHKICKNFQGRVDKYDAKLVIEYYMPDAYVSGDIKLSMLIETKDFDKNIFIPNKGDVERVFINECGQLEIVGNKIVIDSGKEYRFHVMNEYRKIKNIAKEVLDDIKNNYNF